MLKEAGLPDGVFNIVQGEGQTGAELTNHPDAVQQWSANVFACDEGIGALQPTGQGS